MDELHLDTKVDILKRTYKVDANVGARRWRSRAVTSVSKWSTLTRGFSA